MQDTSCERIPRLLCGAGCSVTEGEEECHDKLVDSPVNLPEEHCDLSPQTVCHQVRTKKMDDVQYVCFVTWEHAAACSSCKRRVN